MWPRLSQARRAGRGAAPGSPRSGGARSCPPIAAYDEARWHAQLDLATASYLATEARAEGEAVVLPALMRLYARDFPDPRAFAAQHATTPVRARLLAGAPVRWGTYDWTIGG